MRSRNDSKNSGLIWVFIASLAAYVVYMSVSFPAPSAATRNRRKIVNLLMQPHAEFALTNGSEIKRVILGNDVQLLPEQEQTAVGYRLRLHVRSSTFTIEARPSVIGKTGLLSFFRDEAGMIRFEPDPGKIANAESRPFIQSEDK
jgi:hypothetical protein